MHLKFLYLAASILAVTGSALSCVEINEELGKEYIPVRHQYDVYTDTISVRKSLTSSQDTVHPESP